MYKEPQYAKQRLLETVVRWKGNAVMVKEITGNRVIFKILSNGTAGDCPFNELDINPVPLGYCNAGIDAQYLARIPMREDWKQGLRFNNLRNHQGHTPDISWKSIANTIEGKYPTIEEAFKSLKSPNKNSVAFSRNFAITKEKRLRYKGNHDVGYFTDVNEYTLEGKYIYLKELATEEIGFENRI